MCYRRCRWLQSNERAPVADALHRINRDFGFHWIDPLYRCDWRMHMHTQTHGYASTNLSLSFSCSLDLMRERIVGWLLQLFVISECVFFLLILALMKIDRECKFAIVLANCFSIEAVCQRLFNGFRGKMCTFSSFSAHTRVHFFFFVSSLHCVLFIDHRIAFYASKLINTMQWKIFNHIYR